jgi:hypothetical protein
MKKTAFVLALAALSFSPVRADVGEASGSKTLPQAVTEEETTTFSGEITAIESDRDSVTVANSDGTVKMFAVTDKESYSIGDQVTVSYVDAYAWPLKVESISKAGASAEK